MACFNAPTAGYKWRYFAAIEATAFTAEPIYDCTPLDFTEFAFGMLEATTRRETGDRNQSRDGYTDERINGAYEPKDWSFTSEIRPSGTAGTAPIADMFYEAALGTGTNSPGVSEIYTIDECDDFTLSLYAVTSGGEQCQRMFGAIVQQMVITIAADASPTVEFSGQASNGMDAAWRQQWTDDPGIDAATTPFTGTVDGPYRTTGAAAAAPWTYVTETEHYDLTAIVVGTAQATITRGIDMGGGAETKAEHAQNLYGLLEVPAFSSTGVPITETECTVSFDAGTTDLTLTSGSVTYNTGLTLRELEAGESRVAAVQQGDLTTEWEFTFQARDDTRQNLKGKHAAHEDLDIHVELGDTAGDLALVDMPKCEITEIEEGHASDQEGLTTMMVRGIAKSTTATHYDAISVIFN